MSLYFSKATETHHRPLFLSSGGVKEMRSCAGTGLASSPSCSFSRLETILVWEIHCYERDLDSERPLARVVETWSESWLCHVLTFQTLGLSINVFGSSVSTPGKWEVIRIVPICISLVKVFHIHTKSYDMTLMGKWWAFVAAWRSRDQNLPYDSKVQQTVPLWLS